MDRKKLLAGVLSILFIIMAYRLYGLFKEEPPKKIEPQAPMVQRGTQPRTGVTPAPAPAGEKGAPGSPLVTMIKFEPVPVDTSSLESQLESGQWGREPFLTPEELKPPAQVEEKPVEVEAPITVSSILISGNQKVAIINGDWYLVGELVGDTGYRVYDITTDGVLLEKGGQQKLKPLRPNPVEGKVTSRER